MAVKLRLKRMGRKNRPFYRLAVMDGRKPRGGATIEVIGHYDPLVKDAGKATVVDKERAEYWLKVGAQPSFTVRSILRKQAVTFPVKSKRKRRKSSPKEEKK
ncbi:MAG TPA: 30S ribosomal protein S16 [Planctomycetota bacterium]|jgi:small subunit ribosomal protein S16|nr:30S ribosomal protein S16 [Planctomycetota bacterium]OQC21537.1 MAG: 30S ribosomal protein S16 [Planctomycetes bacterium ADurb.Bin069]NMD36435.1 30S ribosomal protein S16 [Planctomycetota bacterium]HNR98597.1 30S ribosomal protein S16 [Planctomycetota bacterium]HNU26142.1 30S ribosomal protein S16 [Planctomycetota bacterium]